MVLNEHDVLEEWLFGTEQKKAAKERLYFVRKSNGLGEVTFEIGPPLVGRSENEKQRANFISRGFSQMSCSLLRQLLEKFLELMPPTFGSSKCFMYSLRMQ